MRGLIYVPVLHSPADLGSLAEDVRGRFVAAFGLDAWERKAASVEAMWQGIRERLLGLPLDWPRVRLYQDGLPVCADTERIARDLAAGGSRNHELLLELAGRGAALMGTEDPAILVREYRHVQRLAEAARGPLPKATLEELARLGTTLLAERDRAIARRIDETLGEAETGILFIGLLHRVDELLEGKVELRPLIHTLPFGADLWRRVPEGEGHGD